MENNIIQFFLDVGGEGRNRILIIYDACAGEKEERFSIFHNLDD